MTGPEPGRRHHPFRPGALLAVPTARTLVVSEVFGPTIQGEGPAAGRCCSFVRLGGCNLTCDWCDTPYTWDAPNHDLRAGLIRRPVADITAVLEDHGTDIVVLTGGEPLLHQRQQGWQLLLDWLHLTGRQVHVETNGTIVPSDQTLERVAQFVVSPKLANSGEGLDRRYHPGALGVLRDHGADFKFVCRTEGDVAEAAALVCANLIWPGHVWIMPEGTSGEAVADGLRRLAPRAIGFHFNLTGRMHTTIWGDERGR